MQITEPDSAPQVDTGKTREGDVDDKVMLEGREGSPNNYRFLLETPITDWTTPRHRHDFDQIRLAITGELDYAPGKVLPEGWVAYFPEGVYYGPQVKKPGLVLGLFQIGGASGHGYSSNRQKKAAYQAMLDKGKFENGVFTYVDENGQRHNQDAAEARRERVIGHKVDYRPRYEDIIIINPANFDWLDAPETPGVAYKWLGSFTERATRAGFVRMEAGTSVNFGTHTAPEIVFAVSGNFRLENRAYGKHTAIGFETGEGPVPLHAVAPTELFYIQLPTF